MILVDANLLVYAYVKDLPQHRTSLEWLDKQLNEVPKVGLPWTSLLAFVRLVSNPKIFKNPVAPQVAWQQVETWLSAPSVWIPSPTSRHAAILGELLSTDGLQANDVPDVHLAALAIEHDLVPGWKGTWSSDYTYQLGVATHEKRAVVTVRGTCTRGFTIVGFRGSAGSSRE